MASDTGRVEAALGSILTWNNAQVRRHATDRDDPNPRPLEGVSWNDRLESNHRVVEAEWSAFKQAGGQVQPIEDMVDEHQGNVGPWRAGLLISRGKPATDLARWFPRTVGLLEGIPGLWSALWSVFEAGAELPTHAGPNAGVLRYHLGVVCPTASELVIEERTIPYRAGRGILFDDTVPHRAHNHSDTDRVTLFLEIMRPTSGPARWSNPIVQRLLALDPRYRKAPSRADDWHRRVNADLPTEPPGLR